MARTKSETTFRLDVAALPKLGEDAGLSAAEKKVTCGNGKVETVTYYHATTKQGLAALLNAGLAHIPTSAKVDGKEVNLRQAAQDSLLCTAVSAYINGLAAQSVRARNMDPITSLLPIARKKLENALKAGTPNVVAIYNEGKERVDSAVRKLAQRMYDARVAREKAEAEAVAGV